MTNTNLSLLLPVSCCGEPVHHSDGDGANAKDTDNDHVDQFGEKLAVEAVVEPRNEATNSEETNADIVKLVEQFGDVFTVTANCVEQRGHSQTENSTNEEEQEHEFLPERNISVTLITEGLDVEDDGHSDEGHEANQMCPNVSCF